MLKTTTYTPVHPSSNPRTSLPNIGDRSPSNIASSSSSTSASGGAISEPRLGSRPNSALPSSSNVSVVSTTEYESRPRAGTLPGRGGKIKRLTGEDDAQAYVNARVAIASQPLYLKPAYGEGSIRMNPEGDVICGTVEALVEHLTIDSSLRKQQEKQYRYTFLTTFKSFISAESLLSLLTERYRPEQPRDLSDAQYDEWKSKKLHPMQNRVLMVLESWIVHHHLLDTDAWIARKVVEFLSSIQTPASLALTAKHIIQTIENMSPVKPTKPAAKRKKSKPYSKDFAKMDPGLLAEHLTLLEAQIYSKIRSNECLLWANYQTGEQVANLTAWRRMGDKLSAWVKMSVLDCDQLGKRADVIDLWILVAEKCKDAKNVSSMTSIVMGLSHITITKLKLSWAHVKNNARLDPLVKLADPANSYAAYRAFYQTLDGPCVPYLGQYLAAIEHIEKHYPDIVALPDADPARPMIDFVKRTKWAEVIAKMLKYQTKPYAAQLDDGSADPVVLAFVQDQLNSAVNVDSGYFAGRSENLQAAETEHADIRRNLKAAGF
ncbi:hypothetical protein BOTBODRAFT_108290 [Botryobasidium botryosum FD-172 SS1]|uniref:Ras-GEF domain-containing protein n=1 Tax=Botryobasidium botryosum (strain FD-172 SS1) TaxID=930990 RepID=A0A067MIK8_BOTB1|nr:hypothetical protein BOTBODRAFT_108290 [Botryobasidium botryosum FD-172 SS1]